MTFKYLDSLRFKINTLTVAIHSFSVKHIVFRSTLMQHFNIVNHTVIVIFRFWGKK